MRRPVTQEELGTAAALLIIRSQFRHLIRMPPAHLLGEAFRAYPTGRRSQDMSERRHLLTALDMPLNPPPPQRAEGGGWGGEIWAWSAQTAAPQ